MLLGQPQPDPAFLLCLEAVQGWTRRRFKLPVEAPVLVSEVACTVPGCPPTPYAIMQGVLTAIVQGKPRG